MKWEGKKWAFQPTRKMDSCSIGWRDLGNKKQVSNFMYQLMEVRLREINILNLEELFRIGGPKI
jgi:hypothetical protein